MREVVQFMSDSKVYFDFSSRLLYLEDGTSTSLSDAQSTVLRLFVSNPNTVISSRQIASLDFNILPVPDNYHETLSADSDNASARKMMSDLRNLIPILKPLIKVQTRFGYIYTGNQLAQVSDDWMPDFQSTVATDSYAPNTDSVASIIKGDDVSFPYEGEKPFVFVSYAHKNSTEVMGILKRLNEYGLRIWYDEGIEWGSEWPQSIAEHLKKSSLFLAFHSKASIVSPNCRQEVAYAIKNRKTILSVYLEDVELPDGMDMQLSIYQALYKEPKESQTHLAHRLLQYQLLDNCLERKEEKLKEDVPSKRSSKMFGYALFVTMLLGICIQPVFSPFSPLKNALNVMYIINAIADIGLALVLKIRFSKNFETCDNEKPLYALCVITLVWPMILLWLIPTILTTLGAIVMCFIAIVVAIAIWGILI